MVTIKNLAPVLLVEDSPDDVQFARRALARCGILNPLVVAEDGDSALALLTGQTGERRLQPGVVLLDLNIPGLNGRELLKRIKSDEALRTIPVVVLTTSTHPSDVDGCYRSGANSYHRKPDDLQQYQETIRQLAEYWLSAVVPPVLTTETHPAALQTVGGES